MTYSTNDKPTKSAAKCCCNPRDEVDTTRGVHAIKMNDDECLELDVRKIPPKLKHPTIFRVFDALRLGQRFTLVNDHDPVPLRMQFERLRPEGFTWTYQERGPEVWQVEIGRKGGEVTIELPFTRLSTVNEAVRAMPSALPVLHEFGIDSCCGGDLPVGEAAARHGTTWEEIVAAIDSSLDETRTSA